MKCGFTTEHYFDCLLKAKELGYSIKRVCDYNDGSENYNHLIDKKVILLRHDVDFSLEYAHKLATYENRFGIKSSYYVYLHSETYNALAPENMEIIRKIKKLGHEIGLHYDSRYDIEHEDIIVASIQEQSIKSATRHNPSLSNNISDYDYLTIPKLKYISDSGRNWRSGCMCNWIGKDDKLHILVHPIWWIGRGNSRQEVVWNMIEDAKGSYDEAREGIYSMLSDYNKEINLEVV